MIDELSMDDLLVAHAAGRLAEPVALAVATHLSLSPRSRKRFADYEAVGGVLLDSIAPAPIGGSTWDRLMDRIGAPALEPGRTMPPPASNPSLPQPLRAYLPEGYAGLRWRSFGGLAEATLDLGTPDYKAQFIRLKAGGKVLRHTHEGHEITVVLEGAFHDELGRYERGDIAIADASIEHQPVAEPGEDCLCFAVTDAPLRLTGSLGRFLNPFLRI